MLTSVQMNILFENLKDARLFAPVREDRVKIRSGSMTGEWTYVGSLIDPTADDLEQINLAEHFFYKNKRQAKNLRTRIAEWRSEHPELDPAEMEVKMKDRS